MKPTAMLYRNLMAMDVEECIRAYPLDAVVLLGGCDKTVPAELMGAASADVPAIMITGGPSPPAFFRGRELGAGTDLWHYVDELRGGRMSQQEFDELEAAAATDIRALQRDGHRLDDDLDRRGPRDVPARDGLDPRRRRRTRPGGGGDRECAPSRSRGKSSDRRRS